VVSMVMGEGVDGLLYPVGGRPSPSPLGGYWLLVVGWWWFGGLDKWGLFVLGLCCSGG